MRHRSGTPDAQTGELKIRHGSLSRPDTGVAEYAPPRRDSPPRARAEAQQATDDSRKRRALGNAGGDSLGRPAAPLSHRGLPSDPTVPGARPRGYPSVDPGASLEELEFANLTGVRVGRNAWRKPSLNRGMENPRHLPIPRSRYRGGHHARVIRGSFSEGGSPVLGESVAPALEAHHKWHRIGRKKGALTLRTVPTQPAGGS